MDKRIEWLVLSQLPGVGPVSFWQLLRHFGTPAAILRSTARQLKKVEGIGERQIKGLDRRHEVRESCMRQIDRLHTMGGDYIVGDDPDFPPMLKEISDPPPVLFVLGDKGALVRCCIAVVGSRASTSYGKRTAFALSKRLAEHDVAIVSGMALGIDTEAHRGALEAQGKTIAVLGCGLDVVYPKQNKDLYKKIAQHGAVVSEYPLGTQPEGFRFPARNRIISGLSRGVLVVEAAKKSGSLITAQLALDEGREVYGVPGQVDSFKSEGTHWLLQQGAKLVQSERDILEDIDRDFANRGRPEDQDGVDTGDLDPKVAKLYNCTEPYPLARDELIKTSGMDISDFSESLLLLELEGLVEILPGDEICRISKNKKMS